MTENTQGGLSEAEQAYFDSEGATHFEAEDNAETQAQTEADKTGLLTDKEAQLAVEGKNDDDEGVRDEKGRFVNYGALHKERSQRRELEQEVSGLKQFKAAMEEKMRWTEALLAPGTEKTEEAPPDPEQDIFAYSKWQAEQLAALKTKIEGQEKQTIEQKQAEEHETNVWNYWHQSAAAYKAETADFDDAVKWMSEERTKQLSALKLHPQFQTEAGIVQQINAELKDIVVAAAQAKISPAEYIYNMAKEWGYKGAAAVVDTNGKIELPGKLKNVEQAQERSRTVAQGSGKTEGTDEISIDSLAAMPQGEFNEWMKVPANAKTFERLMGG